MQGRRTGEQSKRITAFWKKRRTGKRRYPHNLNTIPIFVISSRKITGEVWKTRLPVGNTKRACRGTIAMNSLTSLRWTEKRRKMVHLVYCDNAGKKSWTKFWPGQRPWSCIAENPSQPGLSGRAPLFHGKGERLHHGDWLIIEKIEDVVVGTSIPYNYEKSRF